MVSGVVAAGGVGNVDDCARTAPLRPEFSGCCLGGDMKNIFQIRTGDFGHDPADEKTGGLGISLTMLLPFQPGMATSNAANINGSRSGFGRPGYPARPEARTPRGVYARAGKRMLDLTLVAAALPAIALVTGVSALALWLEGGQPFYSQLRLGRNGKEFRIYKLRTMVRDADRQLAKLLEEDPELAAEWNRTQKLKKDPRITRVGRFLRRTSLDELPQLWNVVKGDMSLVGPRPMLPEQLPMYGRADSYFAVKPGITGIWQVSDRNESSFAYRQKTDREYDRKLSLSLDLRLLFRTVGVVLRGTGY